MWESIYKNPAIKQTQPLSHKQTNCQLFSSEISSKHGIATISAKINDELQVLIKDTESSLSILGNFYIPKDAKFNNVKTRVKGIANKIFT